MAKQINRQAGGGTYRGQLESMEGEDIDVEDFKTKE